MTTTAPERSSLVFQALIARAVRMLNHAHVMHTSGHVAARDPDDPSKIWINSRKASRSTLTAHDIVPVNLQTEKRIGSGDEPPSEFAIHGAIFRRHPEVGAIVHTHPDNVVALSIAGLPLLPVHVTGAFLPEAAPVFDDPNLINTRERGEAVADALGDSAAVVLRGHGIVVVGDNVEEVFARTALVEENARFQSLAAAMGTPRGMRGEELARARRDICQPIIMRKHWHYHEETARSAGALDGVDGT